MRNRECESQVKVNVNSRTKPHLRHNDNTTRVGLMKTAEKKVLLLILLGLRCSPAKTGWLKSNLLTRSFLGLYSHKKNQG